MVLLLSSCSLLMATTCVCRTWRSRSFSSEEKKVEFCSSCSALVLASSAVLSASPTSSFLELKLNPFARWRTAKLLSKDRKVRSSVGFRESSAKPPLGPFASILGNDSYLKAKVSLGRLAANSLILSDLANVFPMNWTSRLALCFAC